MAHVFISHSSKDATTANYICEVLEYNGISCWIAPRNIVPGEDWATSITKAIDECSIFLLVYGQNSVSSSQVSRELSLAGNKNAHIIPYRIDETEVNDKYLYYMSECHWINASPMTGVYKEAELTEAARLFLQGGPGQPANLSVAQNNSVIRSTPKKNPVLLFGIISVGILVVVLMFFLMPGFIKNNGGQANGGTASSSQLAENENSDTEENYTTLIENCIAAEDDSNAFYYAKLADSKGDPEGT